MIFQTFFKKDLYNIFSRCSGRCSGTDYSECLMHIPHIFHWKLCNVTQAYSGEFSWLWNIKYWYNILFPGIPQEILNFQELSDIEEFQIFLVCSGCEYSRKILNMLENSLNQKMVRTLYIFKGYSIFGELIKYFKCPSTFQPIFLGWE